MYGISRWVSKNSSYSYVLLLQIQSNTVSKWFLSEFKIHFTGINHKLYIKLWKKQTLKRFIFCSPIGNGFWAVMLWLCYLVFFGLCYFSFLWPLWSLWPCLLSIHHNILTACIMRFSLESVTKIVSDQIAKSPLARTIQHPQRVGHSAFLHPLTKPIEKTDSPSVNYA